MRLLTYWTTKRSKDYSAYIRTRLSIYLLQIHIYISVYISLSSYRIASSQLSEVIYLLCVPPLLACKSNDFPRQRKMLENCLVNARNVQCFKLKVSMPAPSFGHQHSPQGKISLLALLLFSLPFLFSFSFSSFHPLGLSDLHCIWAEISARIRCRSGIWSSVCLYDVSVEWGFDSLRNSPSQRIPNCKLISLRRVNRWLGILSGLEGRRWWWNYEVSLG